MAKGIKITWLHVVVVAVVVLFLFQAGYINWQVTGPEEEEPPIETDLVSVNKPMKFALLDPLAGSAIPNASIMLYGADNVMRESLETGSDGTVTSALPYESDTVLYAMIEESGYVTKWTTVTVPKMSAADAESLSSNFVSLQTYDLGTYTIKVTDQFGNSYDSLDTLNFTTLGASSVTLTITIYNTEDNSGYISSYDRLNAVDLDAVMVTSTEGSDATVSGAGSGVTRGANSYWLSEVSPDGMTRQLVGSTYVKSGVTSMSITLGEGAIGANETQDFVFGLYGYFDMGYFMQNGIGGPDALLLTSFTLTVTV